MATNLSLHGLVLLLLLVLASAANAQSNNNSSSGSNVASPYIGIFFLIFTAIIIFLAIFYYYLRERCFLSRRHLTSAGTSNYRVRQQSSAGGLDPAVVKAFPELTYSDAKAKWVNAGQECSVCLSAFEDHETLRLLPNCGHVFHADCVGRWLAHHTTCPCCRADLLLRNSEPNDVVLDVGNTS